MNPLPRFSELVDAFCDETLDESAVRELESILSGSPQARDQFLDACHLHTQLAALVAADRVLEDFAQHRASAAVRGTVDGWLRRIEWRRHPTRFLAASAMLTLAIWIVLAAFALPRMAKHTLAHREGAPREVVAQLQRSDGARWNGDATGLKDGASLLMGQEFDLLAGTVEIVYRSGARTTIAGPAKFAVAGRNLGRLMQGRMVAEVPQPAVGFTILTPDSAIVDRGTRFGLVVMETGTDVVVLEGSVELLTDAETGQEARPLAAGEAFRVSRGGPNGPRVARSKPDFAESLRFADRLPGEVARYEFENSAKDAIGPPYRDGSVGGQVQFVPGRNGLAAKFGVWSERYARAIHVPRHRAFNPGAGSFSFAFWIKRAHADQGNADGVFDALLKSSVGYHAVFNTNHTLTLRLDTAADRQDFTSHTRITDGGFHHVAATVDRTLNQVVFFFDGAAESPLPITFVTGSVAPSQNLMIGGLSATRVYGLDGQLDDLQFFNRVLSTAEVAELAVPMAANGAGSP